MMINNQLILEEDYDEAYVPPEDGNTFSSCLRFDFTLFNSHLLGRTRLDKIPN